MASPPDEGIATMAGLLGDALRRLDDALSKLGTDGDHATASADGAIAAQRELETAYYSGMVGLLVSRIERSGSRAASCTAAPLGSARPWSTSPSASSTPSSSKAKRYIIPTRCRTSDNREPRAAPPTSSKTRFQELKNSAPRKSENDSDDAHLDRGTATVGPKTVVIICPGRVMRPRALAAAAPVDGQRSTRLRVSLIGVVFGSPRPPSLGFWWIRPATVYAIGLFLIAAVRIGFTVADRRKRLSASKSTSRP